MKKLIRMTPHELSQKYRTGERDFRYTKLRGELKKDADISGIQTSGSDWRGLRMPGVDFSDSINRRTDFSGIYAAGADFSESDCGEACFDRAVLDRAYFGAADIRRASFRHARGLEKQYYEKDWRDRRVYFPPFEDCKIKGVAVEGLSWKVILDMVIKSGDINRDSLVLYRFPKRLGRLVLSIDFHYIPGTMEEKVERVEAATKSGNYPARDVKDELPFYEISRELWMADSGWGLEKLRPAQRVTKKHIEEVRGRVLNFFGLKRK